MIYTYTFLSSLVSPFISNAFQSAIVELFDKSRIQKVTGYTASILSSVIIGGPILAGILFGLLEFNQMILIFLIFYSISFFLDFFLKLHPVDNTIEDTNEENKNYIKEFTEGLRFILNHELFSKTLIVFISINFFGSFLAVLPEKMMIDELNFLPEQVGIVNAVAGTGILIGGYMIGKRKNIKNPLAYMKFGFALSILLIPLYILPIYLDMGSTVSVLYISLLFFMYLFLNQISNVPFLSFIQIVVPHKIKGRFFAATQVVNMVLNPLGIILFSLLYDLGYYWQVHLIVTVILLLLIFTMIRKTLLKKSEQLYIQALHKDEH